MKYELWLNEPFLREMELQKRELRILEIIDGYLRYRNIVSTDTKKAEIVEFIVSETINNPFLKAYTIRWALYKYTDLKNQNVSAAHVMDMIKKGMSNEVHKAIVKRWDDEDQASRIPQMSESQKEEKKKADRLIAWNIVVDLVKSGDSQFHNSNWIPAIKHLAFGIKYLPDELTQEHFNETAKEIVFRQIEDDKQNPSQSKDDRTKTLKDLVLIAANQIQGTDIESRINNLRQRMICENYIKENL